MTRPQTPTEQFVRRLTEHQNRLYAYIMAILGDPGAVGDVFQDTNVAIWRKAGEYREGTDFWAWVSRTAYFEILAYRKRRGRDRHVFDDALLQSIAEEAAEQSETTNDKLATLRRCIARLAQLDQELLSWRYGAAGSIRRLAEERGKTVGAISQALYRIRGELADCMEQLAKSEDPHE
jgi:RNA polymerase sigma-70 factor, ECF subfamily